jgi:hypothetical protein
VPVEALEFSPKASGQAFQEAEVSRKKIRKSVFRLEAILSLVKADMTGRQGGLRYFF